MAAEKQSLQIPALALRGLTVFPHMQLSFDVGRLASIKALDECLTAGKPLFLVTQRDLAAEEPGLEQLYQVGTVAKVRQLLRLPGDSLHVMVEGIRRARLTALSQTSPFLLAEVEGLEESAAVRSSARAEALIRRTYEMFERYTELVPGLDSEILLKVLSCTDPGYIADYIAQNISMRSEDKQAILEELRPLRRLQRLCQVLSRELEILELEQQLQDRVREAMSQNQREHYLREQMRAIRSELGEGDDDEAERYRKRIADAKLPAPVEEKLLQEVDRLQRQGSGSPDAVVLRNYLDNCLALPWNKRTKERVDVAAARKVLDADHYGLEKVKQRILEFLAVKQLSPELKGQVLCLVGPPGVGKTSIAMSVARALNRKLGRIALGGIHDEAEIRGHRKTYVGAMPGRILAAMQQAGSSNPLLLLDEIDKLGSSVQGDPASALLEVLDGEQNGAFRDHYLEVPYDLSDVLFITTANTTQTIPRPLLDRMEVLELTSYTDEEKLQIAWRHLLPKERKRHGLRANQMRISDDAIREVITGYTREAGVRILERELAALCRKTAMAIVEKGVKSFTITPDSLTELLGVRRFHPEQRERAVQVGVVNGLAWTSVGGELLEVEAAVTPGTGKVELTGNLGDVMKESAHAALTYIRSNAARLGLDPDFYKNSDIHVHFPEGAVPKDGPSAGVAMAVAMVSALTGVAVKGSVAMTGEITLRGRVLPIGGVKEKTMAAFRNGLHTVLLPKENEPDLAEIDPTVRRSLHFVLLDRVDTALAEALERPAVTKAECRSVEQPGKRSERALPLRQ